MNKKSFWHNSGIVQPVDDKSLEKLNYLLMKENEILREEVELLRNQVYEVKNELSRSKMLFELIENVIQDHVADKIDFIREIINPNQGN
jgi:hypothetical protein